MFRPATASMAASIPRFLLPQGSSIWQLRTPRGSTIARTIRNASQNATRKPNLAPNLGQSRTPVLEKPAKFNPPSHGSKLRKEQPRYPGPRLSESEVKTQQTKQYPNMMPPEGSFMHWFLHNRAIHLYITLGTLFSLAGYSFVVHFKRTSKFADMFPPASDLFFHPISFVRTCVEVLRLHTAHVSAETAERRRMKVDDIQKRATYRKKHGLEHEGFGGWTAKTDAEDLGPALPTDTADIAMENEGSEEMEEVVQVPRKKVKKWLGIW